MITVRVLRRGVGCACRRSVSRVPCRVLPRVARHRPMLPPSRTSTHVARTMCSSRGGGGDPDPDARTPLPRTHGKRLPHDEGPPVPPGSSGDSKGIGSDLLRRLHASARFAHRLHRSVPPVVPGLAESVTSVARSMRHVAQRVIDLDWSQSATRTDGQRVRPAPAPIAGERLRLSIPPTAATVTFQGAGLLLVYEIGVAKYVAEQFEPPAMVSGASGGALVAALLACDVDMEQAFTLNNHMVSVSGDRLLGPFVYGLHDLAQHLQHLFPDDDTVRQRCNDRLVVSLTHVPSMRNKLVHRYDGGKEQLLRVVLSSMNLPLFLFPLKPLDGDYHIDGGLTDNSPRLTAASVTVSPTDDTADIRPDAVAPALPRKHFFVPAPPQTMREFFDRGYTDAHAQRQLWLQRGFKPKGSP